MFCAMSSVCINGINKMKVLNLYTLSRHMLSANEVTKLMDKGHKFINLDTFKEDDSSYRYSNIEFVDDKFKGNNKKYLALYKYGDRVMLLDRIGTIRRISVDELNSVDKEDFLNYKDGKIEYLIVNNTDKEIDKEYNKYITKSKLIGLDNSFKYIVANGEVIAVEFTGKDDSFEIPKFVTGISRYCFTNMKSNMKRIKLHDGIKLIDKEFYKLNDMYIENDKYSEYGIVEH